jgi:hypothetical protein
MLALALPRMGGAWSNLVRVARILIPSAWQWLEALSEPVADPEWIAQPDVRRRGRLVAPSTSTGRLPGQHGSITGTHKVGQRAQDLRWISPSLRRDVPTSFERCVFIGLYVKCVGYGSGRIGRRLAPR